MARCFFWKASKFKLHDTPLNVILNLGWEPTKPMSVFRLNPTDFMELLFIGEIKFEVKKFGVPLRKKLATLENFDVAFF